MRIAPAVVALLLATSTASAEQIILTTPITNFAATALGGIRTIIRYAVPRPDRTETAYLLLGEPSSNTPGAAPIAIQTEGPHGDPVTLSDIEGADCTLARTAIIQTNHRAVLIRAARTDDTRQVLAGSLSQPGPMAIQTYRSRPGGDAGESSPVFTAEPAITHTTPICSEADVQRALDQAARMIMQGAASQ